MNDGRPGPTPPEFPAPIRATSADLPAAAAAALADVRALPETGARSWIVVPTADGAFRLSALAWGPVDGRPLLLVHGVTSSARTYWRLGPALGALGWRAVALDLPGHGRTGGGRDGRGFRFEETARVVAAFARAAFGRTTGGERPPSDDGSPSGAPRPGGEARLAVIGHSWGAVLAAHLPTVGLRPSRIVLLDPPVMDGAALRAMVDDADSQPDRSPERALATIRALKPTWGEGDQVVKAEALTQLIGEAAAAVLLGNGEWDGGLGPLTDPKARGVPIWIVRGEDASGSLTPSSSLPRFAAIIGPDHILTIADGEHSPQRQRVEATLVALLRALGDAEPG